MSSTVSPSGRADMPAPPNSPVEAPGRRSGRRLLTILGPFIGLALVITLFSIPTAIRATFLSPDNFRQVAAQTVITGLGALGMTLIIISGGIDLSVGSVMALCSVVVALMLNAHVAPFVAMLAAIALGAVTGAVNGSLITGLRVTPFIVTLGTLGIARGVASWLANQQAVNADGVWLTTLAATFPHPAWLQVSPGVWITLAMGVVTAIILHQTVLGRYIVAIGSNETTSRLSGLRVDALKIGIYALAGLFFGLAGSLAIREAGAGRPDRGRGGGTGRHRGGRHRRGEPVGRRGVGAGVHHRGADHVVPAQRLPADGLAVLRAADHHRRRHHRRRGPGPPPAPGAVQVG